MNLFCDCEFNSLGGALLSLALVSEDGNRIFYEVLDTSETIDPWVKDNVMPCLEKPAIEYTAFQTQLKIFLKQFPSVHVIADYPIDIKHLCQCLETGAGDWMEIQPITFEIIEELSAKASKVPHNAKHDAIALRNSWLKREGFDYE